MLSPPAISGPEIPPITVIVDSHMLGTTEGGIQDWRPIYELNGFNRMILRASRKLTDLLTLLASNPLNDGTYDFYFPFGIYSRIGLRTEIILSRIRPLRLSAGGDIENQAGCGSPDQIVFFEQLRNC